MVQKAELLRSVINKQGDYFAEKGMVAMQLAGKKYTKEDILRLVEEEDVEFIRLQFTDMFGCLKIWPLPPASWKRRWITGVCLTVRR